MVAPFGGKYELVLNEKLLHVQGLFKVDIPALMVPLLEGFCISNNNDFVPQFLSCTQHCSGCS